MATLTTALLKEAGEALFGPHWHAPLADALGVSLFTVWLWASGRVNVPDRVAVDLWRFCVGRRSKLERIADQLEAYYMIPGVARLWKEPSR